MSVPSKPKIYHIVHVDRLESIIADGCLWCDAEIAQRDPSGTIIGMSEIKQRRLTLALASRPGLRVGDCVPFYFCPRSVMLYLLHRGNHPELAYHGGQAPIVHLECDFCEAVRWGDEQQLRWAFTLSNAGSFFFEDRCSVEHLSEIDWAAVHARDWQSFKDGKQAEFLMERSFPWHLVERIGVHSEPAYRRAVNALRASGHRPQVQIMQEWYY